MKEVKIIYATFFVEFHLILTSKVEGRRGGVLKVCLTSQSALAVLLDSECPDEIYQPTHYNLSCHFLTHCLENILVLHHVSSP